MHATQQDATLAALAESGHTVHELDLEHKARIELFWEGLSPRSFPDVLVNNAGIYPMEDFLHLDEAFLQRTLNINQNSTLWMCQQFIFRRAKRGGIIVNTSSVEAILPVNSHSTKRDFRPCVFSWIDVTIGARQDVRALDRGLLPRATEMHWEEPP